MAETISNNPLYKGSCHCGFISYTVRLSLDKPSQSMPRAIATRCNCSICVKTGAILAPPDPQDSFTLLTPKGEDGKPDISLTSDYQYALKVVHHRFCPHCGVKCFLNGTADLKDGRHVEFWRINLQTLDGIVKSDGDLTNLDPLPDLKDIKLRYFNLKEGDLFNPNDSLSDAPHSGGVW